MKLVFSKSAFRQFGKLDRASQKRIHEKLRFYVFQENPFEFAEPISDSRFGDWRFRIGEYRALFDFKEDTIIILKIGHRRDVYK